MMALLLTMALMIIFAAAIVPEITFEIKRDREEEMIHRGVQYSRAIRAYYKKFGRYPVSIENLESTNQMRFLRKRYKDPLTNKGFRLLHFGEAKLSLGAAGGMIAGANPIGTIGGLTGTPGFAQSSNMGINSANSNSAFGSQIQQTTAQTGASDASLSGQDAAGLGTSSTSDSSSASSDSGSSGFGSASAQTFGGGPIVGVASFSKDPTIRIFDKKKKYSEWQFVYDPALDRGILITTPYQQQIGFGINGTPNLNNQINGNNSGNSGFGSSGIQPTPPPSNNGLGNSNQPSDTPVQQ